MSVSYLLQELPGVHQLAGAVRDVSAGLLSLTVVLQVLVLNVIPSSHHKHIRLRGRGGEGEREWGEWGEWLVAACLVPTSVKGVLLCGVERLSDGRSCFGSK